MGIISSALAAAGDAGVQSMDQRLKIIGQQNLDESRSALETQKQKALLDYQNTLQNAPANRAGVLLKDGAQGTVTDPIAGPVSPSGSLLNNDGTVSQGLSSKNGSYDELKQKITASNWSPQDKTDAIAQLDKQFTTDTLSAQATSQPRAKTSQEAIQSAYATALSNGDMQAATVLKAMIPDKTIKLGKDETIVDAANPNKVIFANTMGTDKERMKIEADRAAQEVKGRQEAILRAMQLDPLGVNAPPGGYMKALSGGASTSAMSSDVGSDNSNGGTIADRLQGKTGDAALAELPSAVSSRVKAILDGRESFPSTARNNPRNAQLLDLAAQVDPDFDAVNFNKRNQTATAFAKGKQGDAVRAANQAIAHAGSLYDSIEKLNNFNGMATPLNYIVNPIQKAFGDDRQGVFQQKAVAVASELRKVFAGTSGGGMHELKEWQDSLPLNASETQQKAYLLSGIDLLHGAVDNLQNQYEQGMGKVQGTKSLLSPTSLATLSRIQGNHPQPDSTPVQNPSMGTSQVSPTDGIIDFGSLR